MLDTWGYKHTLGICTIYCFSTATMVAWTRLGVTLYVLPVVLNVKPDGALVNVEMFAFGWHTRVTSNKCTLHCTSKFHKQREPMGSNHWQLSDNIISRYVKHMDYESEGYGRKRWRITLRNSQLTWIEPLVTLLLIYKAINLRQQTDGSATALHANFPWFLADFITLKVQSSFNWKAKNCIKFVIRNTLW
jgi:hypothetical protein